MCLGTRLYKDKIGNLLIKISNDLGVVYHTKLLKLLFIIDETSVKKYGVPVTWLDYKVWKLGPVPPMIYNDISFDGKEYLDFIKPIKDDRGIKIVAIKEFSDLDFSEVELDLINEVIKDYGQKNADELIAVTHKDNGLWKNIVKSKGDEDTLFEEVNTTPYSIDFTKAIETDRDKMNTYVNALENNEFYASL